MSKKTIIKPDYLIEVCWEVCNKVGGIHTVIATKANSLIKENRDNYILIGPDVWKETRVNPEFIEDRKLLKSWRAYAEQSGLKMRIGRWNIPGKPIVILVDFSTYIIAKDKIFAEFWENYKLDSISGQWDFIEPTLFGYAAGRLIENFWEYNISAQDKIVAHFNEWNSGAGILYLKNRVPQIATIFTTHGTILGHALAKNNISVNAIELPIDTEALSFQYNVRAKYSLEKISAENCDCFTTVSLITSHECEILLNKKVDIVTPNGFDSNTQITNDILINKRKTSRKILSQVAKAVLKREISTETQFILTSGRYEMKNKGFDVLINALGKLNKEAKNKKDIVVFISALANSCGFRQDLELNRTELYEEIAIDDFLTHWIFDYEHDPIISAFIQNDLHNLINDNVKVIFVPTYLDGEDGIFNSKYYDLLPGFDLTIFPSFYEPWGYTPLESICFGVPTVTSSLSGFGNWVKEVFGDNQNAVSIIDRTENNNEETENQLVKIIKQFNNSVENDIENIKELALTISKSAYWDKLISNYYNSYNICLDKAAQRFDKFKTKVCVLEATNGTPKFVSSDWRKILVKINLPDKLIKLQELSRNLWWCWNYKAIELFSKVDEQLWELNNQNPISMLETLSYERCQQLIEDKDFMQLLEDVYSDFDNYLSKKSECKGHQVAYFSMEYGLHDSLKIFSGGLGMLAGDYMKEASDSNVNMIGIGLLYRYGYFTQQISNSGDQLDSYQPQIFSHLPIIPVIDAVGNWSKITIAFPGRTVYAKIWRVEVGRIPLLLLDTDIEENSENDRKITHQLYGGDWDNRLKQEILLGIGGVRMLEQISVKPDIYHCNEGHAAFAVIERLKNLMQNSNISFSQATEIVRGSSLFTTHTPVPAGHDYFSEDMLRVYMSHYPARMNISWETFINLGRIHQNDVNERFSMSVLAAKLSQEINAVSEIHGRVTREMFKDLYKGYFPEELHIGYVTNGVHYPTWTHKKWQQLHKQCFGDEFLGNQSNPKIWEQIYNVPDERIWNLRTELRTEMMDYIRIRLTQDMTRRQENPKLLFDTLDNLRNDVLTIGFARRFATYKRAYLLFSNLEKLSQLINNPQQPIQFIYAGKAHPADKAGQDLIKRIIEVSRMKEFIGKIIFIENYDMQLAKKLISGCDIWLNTPTRPLEASGTSGEKAVMNGVLNFSVLDGWWAEGYTEGAGWALKEEQTYSNNDFQDVLDAETIYNKIEDEIAPIFYNRNKSNIPEIWLSHIRKTFSCISPTFTMKRQLDDYYSKFYSKLFERTDLLKADNFELSRKIARWKRDIINAWDSILIISVNIINSNNNTLMLGDTFTAEVTIDLSSIKTEDIGIEILFAKKKNDVIDSLYKSFELQPIFTDGSISKYSCQIPAVNAGVYNYIFRMYPKNDFLPHRQDFELVRWF